MVEDIDAQIADAEREIEKLKVLKAKKAEISHLKKEIEAGGISVVPQTVRDIRDSIEGKKEKKTSFRLFQGKTVAFRKASKIVSALVVFSLVLVGILSFVSTVIAAAPVIGYANPADGATFIDSRNGSGVVWRVNVSDADSNLASVKLYSNSSGSWQLFYDSGALGGVAYKNASGSNVNWSGSWQKYWWNITANDGTDHEVTYSFTTGYQWGVPQMAVLQDSKQWTNAVVLKNATGDYILLAENITNVNFMVKRSTTGADWSLMPMTTALSGRSYLSNGFVYNNKPYFLCLYLPYLDVANLTGTTWARRDTGIQQVAYGGYGVVYESYGADAIYYNGKWNLVAGEINSLNHRTGTFPSSWTSVATLMTGYQYGRYSLYSWPSLAVHNGILHCIYKDNGYDLHWQTYNGVSWTDKGTIGGDTLDCGGVAELSSPPFFGSIVHDPVNDQLVLVYINTTGDLMYRTTNNLTSWSGSHLILAKGTKTISYPHVEYIDHRIVVTVAYNLRGSTTSNIYTISSPDYSRSVSGLNTTLNRIQFPDSSPGDTNVESTVFGMKNSDSRDIKTIMWHFEDIGAIVAASNIVVWSNMSGVWASIGTTNVGGNVSVLDISGEMAGGGEWIPGQTIYWKVEILAVGSVPEDLHTVDESIYYKVTF